MSRPQRYSLKDGPIGDAESEHVRRVAAIAADQGYLEVTMPLLDAKSRERARDVRLRPGDPSARMLQN